MPANRQCAVCKNPATQRCSACQAVYYCTREHQTADWKKHGKNCRPCRLVESPDCRPHYVATRNIKIGETVLVDGTPLVSGPWYDQMSDNEPDKTEPPLVACAGCYRKVTIYDVKICRNCNLVPLCRTCTTHGAECVMLAKHGKNLAAHKSKDGVLNLRINLTIKALALRDTDPETYRKFLILEERCIGNARQKNARTDDAAKVARHVKRFCDIGHIEHAEVARIAAILQARGHPIELPNSTYTAVYFKASYIDHSCRSNCSKSFTDDGGMIVWAAVPISKGERISINYNPNGLGSTIQRQIYLAENLYINCSCELCKDPTQFGTMYSVFSCIKKNCTGFHLPSSFLLADSKSKKTRNFTCNKCSAVMTWNDVEKMEVCSALAVTLINDIDARRRYVALSKLLHENHFHNVSVQVNWCLSFTTPGSEITDYPTPVLKEVINTCERLIQLFKTISPAKNRLRGQLLFVEIQARTALSDRYADTVNAAKLKEFLALSKKLLAEIHTLMHREPSTSEFDTLIKNHVIQEQKSVKLLSAFMPLLEL